MHNQTIQDTSMWRSLEPKRAFLAPFLTIINYPTKYKLAKLFLLATLIFRQPTKNLTISAFHSLSNLIIYGYKWRDLFLACLARKTSWFCLHSSTILSFIARTKIGGLCSSNSTTSVISFGRSSTDDTTFSLDYICGQKRIFHHTVNKINAFTILSSNLLLIMVELEKNFIKFFQEDSYIQGIFLKFLTGFRF